MPHGLPGGHGPTVPVVNGTLAPTMPISVHLGHGASGDASSMTPWVDGLRERGFDAHALELPKRRAEDAVSALVAQAPPGPGVIIGGHSYGGRVASLAAAAGGYGGLVCLSFPLHRPGGPEIGQRIDHWPSIACPVLLLSGESDPFARIDLLREAVPRIPKAELVTYPKLGHGLKPVIDDVLERMAAFLAGLADNQEG
jgi:predicted alpha/beta-hydrolase family hydrolase